MTQEEDTYIYWFNLGYDDYAKKTKRVIAATIKAEEAYTQGYTAAEADEADDDERADK